MASPPGAAAPIWRVPLYALFDFLSLADPPRRSDCIVVFAGRPEDGGMARLAAETPPALRHFLVAIDSGGARALAVDVRGLGTWEGRRWC